MAFTDLSGILWSIHSWRWVTGKTKDYKLGLLGWIHHGWSGWLKCLWKSESEHLQAGQAFLCSILVPPIPMSTDLHINVNFMIPVNIVICLQDSRISEFPKKFLPWWEWSHSTQILRLKISEEAIWSFLQHSIYHWTVWWANNLCSSLSCPVSKVQRHLSYITCLLSSHLKI